jgi:glycosyltransferase involved in cell wall biosynthesis
MRAEPPPKRILILTSEFVPVRGGIGTYAFEMAQAATELGSIVSVVAPSYGSNLIGEIDNCSAFGVSRFRGGRHRAKDLIKKINLVRKQLNIHTYDIVHAVDWPFYVPVRLARKLHKGRFILTMHGTEINEISGSYKKHVAKALGLFNGWADIVANSQYTHDLFMRRFGPISRGSITWEHLGVSRFWSEVPASREDVRRGFNLPTDNLVLITTGRLTPRKGQDLVIDAIELLPAELRSRITYIIAGPVENNEFVRYLQTRAVQSPCDIRLLNALTDHALRDLYGASDLFCLTGRTDGARVEGFGLVFLEAGAQGLPSIASAIGGVPEVVHDGIAGLLVPPESVERTAQAISTLAVNSELRRNLGKQARQRARALDWIRCARNTYHI